ncbi:hypothetical protein SAMD00023353_9000150 [Rosellinia necatrix]|uniref:Uncharacterized protein n=1 Tax=Rosellinia necatrix TaxID=77044 RepID=A0A1W2TW25_ROSNE|nr:hypothetical protein SAMD00023353_9000150 [Rosellinia necatrix]
MDILTRVPPEVLREILKHLVPDVLPMETDANTVKEHLEKRKALHSLTLVSRYIGSAATEFLYMNLAVGSTRRMVCLFRSLHGNRDLVKHPRSLAILVSLMDSWRHGRVEADLRRHCPDLIETLSDSILAGPGQPGQSSRSDEGRLHPLWTHEITHRMLTMLPLLEDVLVAVWCLQPDTMLQLGQPDEELLAKLPDFSTRTGKPRTIRLLCQSTHFSHSNAGHYAINPTPIQAPFDPYVENGCHVTDLSFLNIKNATSYEPAGDGLHGTSPPVFSLGWPQGQREVADDEDISNWRAQWRAELESLSTASVAADLQEIRRWLFCCRNLKKLTWESRRVLISNDLVRANGGLNMAEIFECEAHHLEELDLRLGWGWDRISFRDLKALRSLTVDLHAFVDAESGLTLDAYNEDGQGIVERPITFWLPETLNHLTLRSPAFTPQRGLSERYPSPGAGYQEQYSRWFARSVGRFLERCLYLPHLNSLQVVQYVLPQGPSRDFIQDLFKNLEAKCNNSGVRLSVQLAWPRSHGRRSVAQILEEVDQ